MSSKPAGRALRLPSPNFSEFNIPRTRLRPRNWFRVHRSNSDAKSFSLSPAHRFSHEDCPFSLLYVGIDIETCLFERFGDTAYDGNRAVPQSLWNVHSVSAVHAPELAVCDLTSAKTLSAMMADLATLMHPDLTIPRAWGLAIQKHPKKFQGIKYKSRFNGKPCLAVFKQAGIEKQLREKLLGPLSDNNAAADWLNKFEVSLY